MATTFLMTEKALDDMIVQIADTYAKMRNNVQDCALLVHSMPCSTAMPSP